MTILVVYSEEPDFPPTDQQPDAKRSEVGEFWVDYLGPKPSIADIDSFLNPPGPISKQVLGPISAATLAILDGEVTGIETSVNFGAAFMVDVNTYWAFFIEPEPDTNYLVLGNVPFARSTDYLEFTASDPSEVSITTWRVS